MPLNVTDLLLSNIGKLPNAGLEGNRTPGINPAEQESPFKKLDSFITSPGGGFLMNLLAQSGYSTTPGSPFGAIGRAAVATNQQNDQREQRQFRNNLLTQRLQSTAPQDPSDVRSFEAFEALGNPDKPNELSPAQRRFLAVKRASQLGDVEGLGRVVFDPITGAPTRTVDESTIVGGIQGRSEAAEAGKQGAVTAAIPEQVAARTQATEDAKNRIEVPDQIAESEPMIVEGERIIAALKSGDLSVGPLRGQLPAFTTEEQLFEAYSGQQLLDKISSVTLGALSKAEQDFLATTVTSRTNTKDANIAIIEKKNKLIRDANARGLKKIGQGNDGFEGFSIKQ